MATPVLVAPTVDERPCGIRGPYYPIGSFDWECVQHGPAVRTPRGWACPVTGLERQWSDPGQPSPDQDCPQCGHDARHDDQSGCTYPEAVDPLTGDTMVCGCAGDDPDAEYEDWVVAQHQRSMDEERFAG